MWAVHVAHHSSERYNLSTALRQPVADSITIAVPYSLLALLGVRPGADRAGPRAQPDLPVLDPHRGDPEHRLARAGAQHPVAPPGPPRLQPALPRPQPRQHPDRLGPAVRHLRAGDRAGRLRPDQEHRHLQPGPDRDRLPRPSPGLRHGCLPGLRSRVADPRWGPTEENVMGYGLGAFRWRRPVLALAVEDPISGLPGRILVLVTARSGGAPSRPATNGTTPRHRDRDRRRGRSMLVGRGGVEPPTFHFSGGRSYQLSYLPERRAPYPSSILSAQSGPHRLAAQDPALSRR